MSELTYRRSRHGTFIFRYRLPDIEDEPMVRYLTAKADDAKMKRVVAAGPGMAAKILFPRGTLLRTNTPEQWAKWERKATEIELK